MNLQEYKAKCNAMYQDIENVLTKHGFKLGKVSAGVDATDGTVRLTLNLADANLKSADGKSTTPEAERFKRYAEMFGLKVEWLGKSFRMSNGNFEVAGLRDTRGAKCVVIKRSDGKTFITTADALQRCMK